MAADGHCACRVHRRARPSGIHGCSVVRPFVVYGRESVNGTARRRRLLANGVNGVPSTLAVERMWAVGLRSFCLIAAFVGVQASGVANAAATASTLDLVTFTAPPGWMVEQNTDSAGGHVVMTHAGGTSYCRIALYSSTPARGPLAASFDAEWTGVALRTLDRVPAPAPTMVTIGNAEAAVGAALSRVQGQPVMGMLIVLDAGASVVSMLVLTPSVEGFGAYRAEVYGMLSRLVVRRVSPSPQALPTSAEPRVAPAAGRVLRIADLAGEWGRDDGINTRYVDRATGAYAATDSLHFTEKWTITAAGGIALDFFGIQNGRKIVEKSTGVVTLSADGILVIRMTNEQRYVLRAWQEGPDITVMTLNGPWYADGIPDDIIDNPAQGVNLDKKWVRQSKRK